MKKYLWRIALAICLVGIAWGAHAAVGDPNCTSSYQYPYTGVWKCDVVRSLYRPYGSVEACYVASGQVVNWYFARPDGAQFHIGPLFNPTQQQINYANERYRCFWSKCMGQHPAPCPQ